MLFSAACNNQQRPMHWHHVGLSYHVGLIHSRVRGPSPSPQPEDVTEDKHHLHNNSLNLPEVLTKVL
jgi:hypothetical protein